MSCLISPGENRGEVEPEAVHVHVGDPVAQAVCDQAEVHDVEAVAGARVVEVVAGVLPG